MAVLDRLARLDLPRRELQQEIDRALDGQQSEVRGAFLRLARAMGDAGLTLILE